MIVEEGLVERRLPLLLELTLKNLPQLLILC